MVKSIKASDIPRMSRESRFFLLLFSSKDCEPCKSQERDLDQLEKQYNKIRGVHFRKIDVRGSKIIAKNEDGKKIDVLKALGVTSVPTMMMWVKGKQVGFKFQPNGLVTNKIEGQVKKDILFREINRILASHK